MNHRRGIIFIVCTSLFLISMLYRASSAIIAPDLSRDLNLDPQDLGLLGAAFFYAFALVQLPLGLFLDRAGAKKTMILLNGIGIVGTVIFARAGGVVGGFVGRGLMGLGMSANLMGTLKLLTRWFNLRKFATLSGLIFSLGTLGSMAATSPLAILVQTLDWRVSFLALAGLHTALGICFLIFVKDRPPEEDRDHGFGDARPLLPPFWAVKTLFRSWSYWAISLGVFLRYGAYAAIQTLWAGPFLIKHLRISPVTAGNLLLMLSIGFIIGSPIGGMLSDRVLKSRKIWVIFASAISGTIVYTLSQWQNPSLLLPLGSVFFAFGFFSSFNQISYAHIRELMPEDMAGTAMTGINFFTMAGAGIFIHGLGSIMKHLSPAVSEASGAYPVALLVCSVALWLNAAIYMTTRESSFIKKVEDR